MNEKKHRVEVHVELDMWHKFKLMSLKNKRSNKAQIEFLMNEWVNGRLVVPS